MKQSLKRLLAVVLALSLTLGFVPASKSVGAEEKQAEAKKATVNVTIVDKTQVVLGKDGTILSNQPVSVGDEDGDGKLTFSDAMLAAAAKYNKDGVKSYATGNSSYGGTSVTRLWGDDSLNFSYYVDYSSTSGPDKEIKDGSDVVAYILADTEKWLDAPVFFNVNSDTIQIGETENLKGNRLGFDSSFTPVVNAYAGSGTAYLTAEDGQVKKVSLNATTDAEGNVSLKFDKPGNYKVVLTGTGDSFDVPVATDIRVVQNGYEAASAYLKKQAQNTEDFSNVNSCWDLINLARSGFVTEDIKKAYVKAAAAEAEKEKGRLDAKYLIALESIGVDVRDFAGYDLTESFKDDLKAESNASSNAEKTGSNLLSYDVIALNGAGESETAQQYADILSSKALKDGGWGWSASFDTDTTGFVLQALAPYYTDDHKDIKENIDKTLEKLKAYQESDGSFRSADFAWGDAVYPGSSNSNTTAEVALGLDSLGLLKDSSFVKNGADALEALVGNYQLSDGSFGYTDNAETNGMATYQALSAVIGAHLDGNYYDFSNVKTDASLGKLAYKAVIDQYKASADAAQKAETEARAAQASADAAAQKAQADAQAAKDAGASSAAEADARAKASAEAAQKAQASADAARKEADEAKKQAAAFKASADASAANEAVAESLVFSKNINKLKAQKKAVTVKLNKVKGASGYEIQVSTSKKFNKAVDTYTTKKLSKKIKGLKRHKKYYVRVRAYRNVNGKKVYASAYSGVKNIKTR